MKIGAVTLSFPPPQFLPSVKTVRDNLHAIFKKCEKGWSYVGKACRITQFSLSASEIRSDFAVIRAVQSLKIFSSIGIPFTMVTIANTAQAIIKSIKERDVEAGVLGGLSIIALTADFIDSIGTVVNTSMALAGNVAVQFFSVVSMPISFVVVGIGTISRSYQLIKTSLVFAKFRSGDIQAKLTRQDLYPFAPKEVVDQLFAHLDRKESPPQELLDKLANALKKKMISESGNLLANFVTIAALILLAAGVSAPVGVTLLAVAVAIRLVMVAHSDLG